MKIFANHQIKLLLFAVFITVSAFSFVKAQTPKPDENAIRAKLQTQLDEWHKAGKFAGATLGVCLADGKCFSLATGFSDLEKKQKMKPTDLMLAGSVGKTYAAAVALQLVKEGKINLDEKIEKYLGKEKWFARLPNAKDITVRQLMNHTSGLIRYEFKDQFTKDLTANPDKVWKPEDLLAYLFDEKPPFEAGKGWDYSDTNYIVLGMIIEKVTGKKYYTEATNRILKPLKLKNTKPQDKRELKGLIQGYAGADNPFGGKDLVLENGKFIINPQFEWTGGGMVSNTEDLARWAKLMYEGRAFDASLLPECSKWRFRADARQRNKIRIRRDNSPDSCRSDLRTQRIFSGLYDRCNVFSRTKNFRRRAGKYKCFSKLGKISRQSFGRNYGNDQTKLDVESGGFMMNFLQTV